eukprot:673578-Rhodomonas_salina.1
MSFQSSHSILDIHQERCRREKEREGRREVWPKEKISSRKCAVLQGEEEGVEWESEAGLAAFQTVLLGAAGELSRGESCELQKCKSERWAQKIRSSREEGE